MERRRIFNIVLLGLAIAVHPFVHAQDLSERGDSLRPSIALKTNVLYDMVLTPNFEIEKDLGRHLSLDVETAFPWYTWHHNLRCYEVFEAGGELRWWTGRFATTHRRRLTGFFLGLYGAGGYYDLEWDGTGHRGEYWSTGLSWGFSRRIARHWNLELSASIGYVGGPYKSYEADENYHPLRKHYGHIHYFGPTKVKVAFVWLIGNRKGRRHP